MQRMFVPGAPLPEGLKRWLALWGPPSAGPYHATLLSDELVQIVCHWSGRLLPCPGPLQCPYCHTGVLPHFMGFLPAIVGQPINDHCVLRLTPHASDELLAIQRDQDGKLRGSRLKLWRREASQKARVRVLCDGQSDRSKLPAAWDVIPHLRRLWGCPEGYPLHRDFGVWAAEAEAAMLHPDELTGGVS